MLRCYRELRQMHMNVLGGHQESDLAPCVSLVFPLLLPFLVFLFNVAVFLSLYSLQFTLVALYLFLPFLLSCPFSRVSFSERFTIRRIRFGCLSCWICSASLSG